MSTKKKDFAMLIEISILAILLKMCLSKGYWRYLIFYYYAKLRLGLIRNFLKGNINIGRVSNVSSIF